MRHDPLWVSHKYVSDLFSTECFYIILNIYSFSTHFWMLSRQHLLQHVFQFLFTSLLHSHGVLLNRLVTNKQVSARLSPCWLRNLLALVRMKAAASVPRYLPILRQAVEAAAVPPFPRSSRWWDRMGRGWLSAPRRGWWRCPPPVPAGLPRGPAAPLRSCPA